MVTIGGAPYYEGQQPALERGRLDHDQRQISL